MLACVRVGVLACWLAGLPEPLTGPWVLKDVFHLSHSTQSSLRMMKRQCYGSGLLREALLSTSLHAPKVTIPAIVVSITDASHPQGSRVCEHAEAWRECAVSYIWLSFNAPPKISSRHCEFRGLRVTTHDSPGAYSVDVPQIATFNLPAWQ